MKDRFQNNLKPKYLLNDKKLSKKNFDMINNFALEAYKIDPSRPISFYFKIFNERLKKNFIDKKIKNIKKDEFFKDEVIEI